MKTYLVESDHEGRLAFLEQVDGLDGLRLEAVHDVDHQDGDITERRTAATKVTATIKIRISQMRRSGI